MFGDEEMSVLISKCANNSCKEFSKELFTEIQQNLKIALDKEYFEKDRESFKKVLFAVYVRTEKDNLVLTLREGVIAELSHTPPYMLSGSLYPNFLLDSGLLCGKNLLDSVFNVQSEEALKRLVTMSTCFPVGAVETTNNYVVVFNVIISDYLLTDSEIALKQGFYFHPIETLELSDSLQNEISKSLVIVRK